MAEFEELNERAMLIQEKLGELIVPYSMATHEVCKIAGTMAKYAIEQWGDSMPHSVTFNPAELLILVDTTKKRLSITAQMKHLNDELKETMEQLHGLDREQTATPV